MTIFLTPDSHYSMNACLAPLCAMHGLAITTVEGIGSVKAGLHPVQVMCMLLKFSLFIRLCSVSPV